MIDVATFYRSLPVLETQRLLFRPLTLDDLPCVYAYASDPEVTRYLRWPAHPSLYHTERFLRQSLDLAARGMDASWGIAIRKQDKLIGAAHLMDIIRSRRQAEVGVVLARRFWGQGYGTESLEAVLGCAFNQLGLERVQGVCCAQNIAGQASMARAGMIEDQACRQGVWQKGAIREMLVYTRTIDKRKADSQTPTPRPSIKKG